ncbi:MAG: patatin-like phospholipase family protein [Acidobacteriota bacterium]|nr:patatin-like phospholipase family protein [Acidobacteriota bacterium]
MGKWEETVKWTYPGRIRNLVFEGGGVWGIAYEGALAELEALGILDAVERVGGASAGAITACLLACGFDATALGRVLRETHFRDFTDDSFGFARDTARLLTRYGWYRGDAFRRWIRRQIRVGTRRTSKAVGVQPPPPRPTLAELARWRRAVAGKGVRLPALYLVGSNLSRQRREIYSAESRHTPDLKVEDAVRVSMSIPLFFAAARGGGGDVLVDGGLTWNYPVNLFDHTRYLACRARGLPIGYARHPQHVFNTETLGFRLDTSGELQANLVDWQNEEFQIDNIVHYGWALVTLMRAVANKMHLHKNDWSRTVFIDMGETIGFTDFDLGEAEIAFLSQRGRMGVRAFLKWRVSKKGEQELRRIYKAMAG